MPDIFQPKILTLSDRTDIQNINNVCELQIQSFPRHGWLVIWALHQGQATAAAIMNSHHTIPTTNRTSLHEYIHSARQDWKLLIPLWTSTHDAFRLNAA